MHFPLPVGNPLEGCDYGERVPGGRGGFCSGQSRADAVSLPPAVAYGFWVYPRGHPAREFRQFETMPVQMDRMYIVACIAHSQPVPSVLPQTRRRRRLFHCECLAIDRPLIESIIRRIAFLESHSNRFVGLCRFLGLAKSQIVPMERLRRNPLRLPVMPCILHYNSHPVSAVVVRQITHYPHARIPHLHDR